MFRPRSLVVGSQRTSRVLTQLVVACFVLIFSAASLYAGDLRIPIPKRSKYTPVQALNRDGVKAVENHQYERAKKLFYKAYLIDPNDPFTLNNLGYMAELDGDSDRASRFYALSAEMGSDAIIDKANNDVMEGKPVSAVAGRAEDKGIKTNRLNNEAISLLEKDRAPEADLVLQKALTIEPNNPFTLNNLGYAKEKEGEIEAAYQFYTASANRDSKEKVEVALNKDWRGRPISEVARDNARKLNRRLRDVNDIESRVALLNLRGVSALNRNDRRAGRDFIQKAFKLAPTDAFTLNNMGYLAEMDGDKETADFYYERARQANQKNARIVVATRKEVEGKKIGDVADTTDQLVQSQMEAARAAREQQGGPVILMRRDNSAVVEPPKPVHELPHERVSNENGELLIPVPKSASAGAIGSPASSGSPAISSQPQPANGGLIEPLPDNEQPTTVKEGDRNGGLMMPLPDDQQPGSQPTNPNVQQPAQQKEGQRDGGMIMPLPDDQQPGPPQPGSQPTQPIIQQAPQSQEGQHQGGMIMPLPDDQQPGAQPPSTQPQTQQTVPPSQPAPQTQPAPAIQAPPAATHTIITNPAPATAPATTSPATTYPATTTPTAPAPSRPAQQQQPAPQQSQPPLLLPPPDNQQNNTGVYTPPRANTNPGNYSQPNAQPAQPNHISDTDQPKPKPKPKQTTPPQNGPAPNKISDQD